MGRRREGNTDQSLTCGQDQSLCLDSQISHLCSEPNYSVGTSRGWKGLLPLDPLTGDVGAIPQVAVKGSDKPVGSSKVGPSPGVVAAVCPQA